jgi:hypothetical protein
MSLTFRADGTYVHWESDKPGEDCDNGGGLEYGQYTYDATTGTLTVMPTIDNNGCIGLAENGFYSEYPVVVNGDRLDFLDDTILDRVQSGSSPIVGGWEMPAPGFLTFFPNGNYLQYQGDYGDGDCEHLGVEYGSYSYDGETDTLLANPDVDENACAGLSELRGPVTVNGDMLYFQEPQGSDSLQRIN